MINKKKHWVQSNYELDSLQAKFCTATSLDHATSETIQGPIDLQMLNCQIHQVVLVSHLLINFQFYTCSPLI